MKRIIVFCCLCLAFMGCSNRPSNDNATVSLKKNFENNIEFIDFNYINGVKSEDRKIEYYKMAFDATIEFTNDWIDNSPLFRGKVYKKGDQYKILYGIMDFMSTDNGWVATQINFKQSNGFIKLENSKTTENTVQKPNELSTEIALKNYLVTNSQYCIIPETSFNSEVLKAARNSWGFGETFNPYRQIGDFNNGGIKDFATLLLNGKNFDDENSSLQIVIFNGVNEGSYQVAHVENFKHPEISNEFYIAQKNGTLQYGVMETDILGEFKLTKNGYVIKQLK